MRKKRNNLLWFILATFLLSCFPAVASAAQWGMHRHDSQHTNSVPYTGPTKISEKWSFQEEITNGGMAIADDGTIYFIDGHYSRNLYVLNPDGTVKQIYDLYANGYGGGCCTRPVIGPDGTIYVITSGIVAFNPDLTEKWYNPNYGGFCCGSMSLGPDGSLYLVEGSLDVLDAQTGNWKWGFDGGTGWVTWAPATNADGSEVYITNQNMIYAKNSADGADLWSYPITNPGTSSAIVAANGDIYVPNGSTVAVIKQSGPNKKGQPKRSISVGSGNEIAFEIALATDGSIVCVTYDTIQLYSDGYAQSASGGKVYMIDQDNVILWSAAVEAEIYPSVTQTYVPMIDANNNVYLGTVDSDNIAHVYGFDAAGNTLFYREFDSNCKGGPVTLAMDSEGTLYFSIFMGYTYAYRQTDPWGNYHGDAQHTNQSAYSGPTQITQLWKGVMYPGRYPGSENYTLTGTAIAADGTIYVGGADGNLYAFNPDGSIKGMFDGSASGLTNAGLCCGAPIIGSDGTIYVSGRHTWALNPDLTIKWTYSYSGLCCGSMTIGPDGTLYLGEWGRDVVAINSDTGLFKWYFPVPSSSNEEQVTHSPAVSHDGNIAYITTQFNVFAVDGTVVDPVTEEPLLLWSYAIENAGFAAAAVGADGRIYVPNGNVVTILNPDGTLSANKSVGSSYAFEVALGANGSMAVMAFDTVDISDGNWPYSSYAGIAENATNGRLYIFKTDGTVHNVTLQGNAQPNWMTQFAPVIDASGNIYIVTRDYDHRVGGISYNYLYGFDAAGNSLFNYQLDDVSEEWAFEGPTQLTIGADGTLYVSWFDGYLYAFGQTPML